jgi:Ni/Fe-hydrogenase subunit HybB-like protein
MVFDITVAMTWLLFLALFPMAFIWLRRTWRIAVRRDYSEVALKKGVTPDHPEKYASYAAAINMLAGVVIVTVIGGVLTASFDYETWSSIAGVTIWLKLIADFILSRHAHPFVAKNKTE